VGVVWHWMGQRLDWAALETCCEILGIDQPELLVAGLIQVRDHHEEKRRAASSVRH
jgi:hypothetical protein